MFDKKCCVCKEFSPLENFHNNKARKDGKTEVCKPCAINRSINHNAKKFAILLEKRREEFIRLGGNWKDVVGWEEFYSICDDGRVLGKKRMSLLIPIMKDSGYLAVSLMANKRKIQITLHRLVAEAFISNPENKREVNHIDGDKSNPHVSNLEWATRKENAEHASRTGLLYPYKGRE